MEAVQLLAFPVPLNATTGWPALLSLTGLQYKLFSCILFFLPVIFNFTEEEPATTYTAGDNLNATGRKLADKFEKSLTGFGLFCHCSLVSGKWFNT